ncbi:tigger transposable element-derived protein 2-like [Bombus pyrosoma]|uniref:tigger transposable element-derived protein 2-like n=1 Tax=Bombus pyrosoma TaxID=396416 RepID=UPI001CB956D2|nr:tigger transposable element-derived protein 2-like [Bombus pyrosoma]
MSQKQKRKVLSADQKYEVLKLKEKGVDRKNVIQKYGISLSALSRLCASFDECKKQLETNRMIIIHSKRCRSWQQVTDLERVLYHWCIQCMEKNVKVTGTEIQNKALELNKKLNLCPLFKASNSWLVYFRKDYGITEADMMDYLPSPSKITADIFKANFNKLLQDGGFSLENVYNVVYTAILWKAVPENSLMFRSAKSTGCLEMCEDHVTALFCANATGCHKLPVLIIGTVPETLRGCNFNTNTYSTIYRTNTNAWMDNNIFNEWFEKYFLESVQERQQKNGRKEKTLLLLDNARSFHDLHYLNDKDEFVTVMSFPLDVSTLIQPMNCEIIPCFKRMYRKEFAKTLALLPFRNSAEDVIRMHKILNIWDSCRIVHNAWSHIDNTILKNAWNSLLNHEDTWIEEYSKKMIIDAYETVNLLRYLPGCELCDVFDVLNWFQIDNIHNIVLKVCTDEVLRDYESNTLPQEHIQSVHDQAGPSH